MSAPEKRLILTDRILQGYHPEGVGNGPLIEQSLLEIAERTDVAHKWQQLMVQEVTHLENAILSKEITFPST